MVWPGVVFASWSRSRRVVSGTAASQGDGLQRVGQAGGMFPGQIIALEYPGSEKRQMTRGKKTSKVEIKEGFEGWSQYSSSSRPYKKDVEDSNSLLFLFYYNSILNYK